MAARGEPQVLANGLKNLEEIQHLRLRIGYRRCGPPVHHIAGILRVRNRYEAGRVGELDDLRMAFFSSTPAADVFLFFMSTPLYNVQLISAPN